jgi:hypothetical protein
MKRVKYFYILLDCTRDADRVGQMTIILRYVDTETRYIEEHYVGFAAVQETIAATLTDTILRELQSLRLDTNDCRRHGCYNGANMVGWLKVLAINPRTFFIACGFHNWNLLSSDAAKSSRMVISFFFGLIQRIYTFSPDH